MSKANERQIGGSHYAAGLQHWDVVEGHGIGYLEGCASKYITRWRKKNGLQDLQKALHYTEKLAELARDAGRTNRGVVPMVVLDRFVIDNDLELTEKVALIGLFRWRKVEDLERAAVSIKQLITEATNAQSRPAGS